ncbi:hypothetical protein ACJX0J_019849, partial [Zea mays]
DDHQHIWELQDAMVQEIICVEDMFAIDSKLQAILLDFRLEECYQLEKGYAPSGSIRISVSFHVIMHLVHMCFMLLLT